MMAPPLAGRASFNAEVPEYSPISTDGHDERTGLFVLPQAARRGASTRRRAAGLYLRRMRDACRRDDQHRASRLARALDADTGAAAQRAGRNEVTPRSSIN